MMRRLTITLLAALPALAAFDAPARAATIVYVASAESREIGVLHPAIQVRRRHRRANPNTPPLVETAKGPGRASSGFIPGGRFCHRRTRQRRRHLPLRCRSRHPDADQFGQGRPSTRRTGRLRKSLASGSVARSFHRRSVPTGGLYMPGLRSEPFGVTTFEIGQTSGTLIPLATGPVPDNMAYISTAAPAASCSARPISATRSRSTRSASGALCTPSDPGHTDPAEGARHPAGPVEQLGIRHQSRRRCHVNSVVRSRL
jgi:hypothetical protein